MRLFFTSLRDQTELRSFSYKLTQLEEGLDLLNFVFKQGDTLLNAHVVDEYSAIELPVEAFDGVSFSGPMNSLEQEWKTLLRKKVIKVPCVDRKLIELALRRVHNCEQRIAGQTAMIDRLEALTKRTEEILFLEPGRSRLINHYQSQITVYRQQVVLSQASHEQLVSTLNKLMV